MPIVITENGFSGAGLKDHERAVYFSVSSNMPKRQHAVAAFQDMIETVHSEIFLYLQTVREGIRTKVRSASEKGLVGPAPLATHRLCYQSATSFPTPVEAAFFAFVSLHTVI